VDAKNACLGAAEDEVPDYGFVKSLHSGSLAKGTALKTLNDMDVAVYVKKSEAPADENALLSCVRPVRTPRSRDRLHAGACSVPLSSLSVLR
jgi:hypothetical protein